MALPPAPGRRRRHNWLDAAVDARVGTGPVNLAGISLPLAFAAGLVSFLSPCVLPLVPVYVAYLTGQAVAPVPAGAGGAVGTIAASGTPPERSRVLAAGAAFVAGLSAVFITFFYVLDATVSPLRSVVLPLAGAVVILIGLHTAGLIRLPWIDREFRLFGSAPARGGVIGGLLLGIGLAVGWTPCIGATLGAVIASGISQGTTARGLVLMLAYSAGLGVPFMLIGLGLERAGAIVRALGRHRRALDVAAGAVLVFMGVLLLTDNLFLVTRLLSRILPPGAQYPFGL